MHADISLTLMKRNLLVSIKIRRQPPQTPLLKDVLMFDSLWEHSAAVLPYMAVGFGAQMVDGRSEEHTSELQSLMRISYAVVCLSKKKHSTHITQAKYLYCCLV